MYCYCMFKVSCRFSIVSLDCPTVICQIYFRQSHRYHRLDGYTQTILYLRSISSASIIRYWRIFMHRFTNAVAYEFTNDSIAFGFTMRLYSITDVSYSPAWQRNLNSTIQGFLCRFKQKSDLLRDFAYTERIARVTIVTIQQDSTVNRNNIPFLQRGIIGHPMYYHIIYRCTYRRWKRFTTTWIRKSLESGNRSIVFYVLFGNLIKL